MVRSFGIFRHAAAVILNPELHLIILAADGDRGGRRLGMLEHVAQGFAGNLQQVDRLVRGDKTRWQLVIQLHREAQPGAKLLTAGFQRRAQPRLGELQTEGGQQLAKLNPRGVKLVADLAEQLFAALGHAFILHLQAAHLHLHAGEGLGDGVVKLAGDGGTLLHHDQLLLFLLVAVERQRGRELLNKRIDQLHRKGMNLASNLFHIGILGIFAGHFLGMLTPHWMYEAWLPIEVKQKMAMIAGGACGVMTLVGGLLLLKRRLFSPRVRATTTGADILILSLLMVQCALGLLTIPFSAQHMDGSEMMKLVGWAQSVVTFRGGASEHLDGVAFIFRVHLVLGMTLFVLFPFSRLVHIWSAPVEYLTRKYQVVRARR